jgi:hypothetical protein
MNSSYLALLGRARYDELREFTMVERLTVLKAAVSADIANIGGIDNLTSAEWKLVQGFVSVCRPLAELTRDSNGETYPTRSMVIPIVYGVYDKLNTFISDPKSKGTGVMFARKVLSALQTRFPQYKDFHTLHARISIPDLILVV